MTGSVLRTWFHWPDGSVLTNLVATVVVWLVSAFLILKHFKCHYCWRPARIPVKGQAYHVCHKCAHKHAIYHS